MVIGSLKQNGVPDMPMQLVICAKYGCVRYAPKVVDVCAGLKPVEVMVMMHNA